MIPVPPLPPSPPSSSSCAKLPTVSLVLYSLSFILYFLSIFSTVYFSVSLSFSFTLLSFFSLSRSHVLFSLSLYLSLSFSLLYLLLSSSQTAISPRDNKVTLISPSPFILTGWFLIGDIGHIWGQLMLVFTFRMNESWRVLLMTLTSDYRSLDLSAWVFLYEWSWLSSKLK